MAFQPTMFLIMRVRTSQASAKETSRKRASLNEGVEISFNDNEEEFSGPDLWTSCENSLCWQTRGIPQAMTAVLQRLAYLLLLAAAQTMTMTAGYSGLHKFCCMQRSRRWQRPPSHSGLHY
jgi:hypothetical protein